MALFLMAQLLVVVGAIGVQPQRMMMKTMMIEEEREIAKYEVEEHRERKHEDGIQKEIA